MATNSIADSAQPYAQTAHGLGSTMVFIVVFLAVIALVAFLWYWLRMKTG